jgi:hypothetical protein
MSRRVILRVWVADRPGSLGQLASRIGELGGDLVGIDILERDGARAVDELTVELPEGVDPDSLVEAVSALAGVEVEDLRHLMPRAGQSGRDPMEAAVLLAESRDPADLLQELVRGACTAFACDWSAVLDVGSSGATALAVSGDTPSAGWLGAFISGMRACLPSWSAQGGALVGPRDVAWSGLDSSNLVVVVGRDGPPFRCRERRQLQQLCRIADARWSDLVRNARESEPAHRERSKNRRLEASQHGTARSCAEAHSRTVPFLLS